MLDRQLTFRYPSYEIEAARDKMTILSAFGFLPGNYLASCSECVVEFMGSKRSYRCEDCATKAYQAHMARQGTIEVIQEHVTVTTNEIIINAMRAENPLPLRDAVMAGVEALLHRLGIVAPVDHPAGTIPEGASPVDPALDGDTPDLVRRAQEILARAQLDRTQFSAGPAAAGNVAEDQVVDATPAPPVDEPAPEPVRVEETSEAAEPVSPVTVGLLRDIMEGRSRAPVPLRPHLKAVEPEPKPEAEPEPEPSPYTLNAAETFMDRVLAENLAYRQQELSRKR